MKRLFQLIITSLIATSIFAQNNPITFDPGGGAGGDLFGIKATENGNNTTKLHIYRNFTFETQDNDKLVIDSGGKVGIGTSTPNGKLHVISNTVDESSVSNKDETMILEATNTSRTIGTGAALGFAVPSNTTGTNTWVQGRILVTPDNTSNNNASGRMYLQTRFYNGTWDWRNSIVLLSSGKIGMGTTTPTAQLEINSDANNSTVNLFDDNQGAKVANHDLTIGSYSSLKLETRADGDGAFIRGINQGNNNVNFSIGKYQSGSGGVSVDWLTILNSGNVGIGTASTGSHKLAVEGSIGAREIKVEASGWSDFVFEKDYELRTLEEVEEHIVEKGHLPEIPSEAEVTKNGINLGEMNAKLLQKIEELTLYLIEQNKQNQSQQAEIEELKQMNIELLKKLESN